MAIAKQMEQEKALPPAFQNASTLLTFVWALGLVNWSAAIHLITLLPRQQADLAPIWGGLFAHLSRLAPDTATAEKTKEKLLDVLIADQLNFQQDLDSSITGLFSGATKLAIPSLELQTFWTWSTQALIDIGRSEDERLHELILLNELYIFETNAQWWQPAQRKYVGTKDATNKLTRFLPLFAAIPDQDQAEEVYLELIVQGFPLAPQYSGSDLPVVPLASVFLLYVGLLEYSMAAAAERLKLAYTKQIMKSELSWEEEAILLLWERY